MNNDNLLIEELDIDFAKDICRVIEDSDIRNRAVANALAAGIAKKFFSEVSVDTESGLHKIAQVLNDIDISDIYVDGTYIDVRLYFNDNELCVPKSHFDRDLLPFAYMFIKINSELSNGLVTGFIRANNVDTSVEYDGYYPVPEHDLVSFDEIKNNLLFAEDMPAGQNIDSCIYNYLDGNLDDVNTFYRELLTSSEARKMLKDAAIAQNVFNLISRSNIQNSIDNNTEQVQAEELSLSDNLEEVVGLELADDSPLEEFIGESIDIEADNLTEDILNPAADDFIEQIKPITEEGADLSFDSNDSNELQEEQYSTETDILESVEQDIVLSSNEPLPEYNSLNEEEDFSNADFEQYEQYEKLDNTDSQVIQSDNDTVLEQTSNNTEFPTNVTPVVEDLSESEPESVSVDELENLLDNEPSSEINQTNNNSEYKNSEQIQDLFGHNSTIHTGTNDTDLYNANKKKQSKALPVISLFVLIAALGYYGYTKFANTEMTKNEYTDVASKTVSANNNKQNDSPQEAMPIESVENTKPVVDNNEGTSVSIPAIEQNLDASILVSNLSIAWEVPAGYISNNTAQRYFNKMGRIIQLNLKAELLLLNKPPITNKIALELEFDKTANKFVVKSIVASSGEKSVDDLITQTVGKALDINLKTNMSTFSSISGNPVLIIRL